MGITFFFFKKMFLDLYLELNAKKQKCVFGGSLFVTLETPYKPCMLMCI